VHWSFLLLVFLYALLFVGATPINNFKKTVRTFLKIREHKKCSHSFKNLGAIQKQIQGFKKYWRESQKFHIIKKMLSRFQKRL
jgi:hypothetical protein